MPPKPAESSARPNVPAEWHKHLEPAYMDRSNSSPSWMPAVGRYAADPAHPYQHKDVKGVLEFLGLDAGIMWNQESAEYATKFAASQLRIAWEQIATLKKTVDMEAIVGFIQAQTKPGGADLKAIVHEAWSEVQKQAPGVFRWDGDTEQCAMAPARNADTYEYLLSLASKAGESQQAKHNGPPVFDSRFLLPFLNEQDLLDPQLLGCLILNRIRNHPRTFARADWESLHVGRASKLDYQFFYDAWFMGFPTSDQKPFLSGDPGTCKILENYTVLFKNPTKNDTQSPLFIQLRQSGLLFGFTDGVSVLAVQTITLQFVNSVAERIAKEMGQQLLGQVSWGLHNERAQDYTATWDTADETISSFDIERAGLVGHGQFFPYLTNWDDHFCAIFQRRLDVAKAHLRSLWHDPFYFRDCIHAQYRQHYGHICEKVKGTDYPLLHIGKPDLDGKKNLVNDLIRDVARWAVIEVETWQCLLDKLSTLRQVAQDHGVSLDPRDDGLQLTGQPKAAWIDLGFHTRWFTERYIQHVANYGGYVASTGLRPGFCRDRKSSSLIRDGWALPKDRLRDPVTYQQHDVDPAQYPGFRIGETSWLLAEIGKALVDHDTMYCIGLPKLAQQIRADQQSRHASHGVQRMTTGDFDVIFLTALLSQKLESLQPFGQDLAEPAKFDALRDASPVRGFFAAFDTFNFEDHVDGETLRSLQWILGVIYSPAAQRQQSRDARLAQHWLESFWTQIAAWLQPPPGTEFEMELTDCEEGGGKRQKPKRRRGKNVRVVKPNKVVKRRTTADCRPPAFRRHWKDLAAGRVRMPSHDFMIDMICGDITTLQPEGYKEPAVAYQSAASGSGVDIGRVPDHIKMSTLNIASHQTFGNYDRAIREMTQKNREPQNKLDRSQVKTMRILFGHGRGTVNWNDAKSLIAALGFELRKEKGSSYTIVWTDKVRVPRPPGSKPKPSIGIHPPHPHTNDIWEDTRCHWRQQFDDFFNINEATIGEHYQFTGCG